MLVDHSCINFNTNQAKKEKTYGKTLVLVAPLDWGLGHATRCVPVIHELKAQGCEVWIAADGATKILLEKEFPDTNFLLLPGYNIKYSNTAKGFIWKIIRQLPKIRSAILDENKWLKAQVNQYRFDAVISDNRFGLYHESVPSVFITHQLNIKSPLGKWNERLLQKWNYSYIKRFTECWVPDTNDEYNLGGELSHPLNLPSIPLHYLGPLSRLSGKNDIERKNHLAILLSGPEPQRSIFENKLIDELVHYNGTADVIRGVPSSNSVLPSTNHLLFYNHLSALEIEKKIAEAEYVISRSGYSTIMDLASLGKKSILVPTPGQTEQEYLGLHLTKKKIAYSCSQDGFSLQKALKEAKEFSYQLPERIESNLKETVRRFISGLKK